MSANTEGRASLENLLESEDLGLDVLHPGGLDITRELAERCAVSAGTSVLDVGCGSGESVRLIADEFGARVMGLDRSAYLLERAGEKTGETRPDVEFRQGDAHHLPFGDAQFDCVISECTVCLLDKVAALREMVRVLKPGGCVAIHDVCWKPDTPAMLKARLAALEGEKPATLDGWKMLFAKAGLTSVEAVDKSALPSQWVGQVRRQLGLRGVFRIYRRILRRWGWRGLRAVRESERIFTDRHTGYAIIIGRKPTQE